MKRTLLLGTAWTASAAVAVGLGFLAVSFVDASASPGTVPLAATSSSTASSASTSPAGPSVAPSSLQPTAQQATEAGMVYASCDRGAPEVAGAPAGGWWVDNSDKPGEVEFEDGTWKLEVHVTCVDGRPVFSVEGPRAEDGRGGDDDGSTSSASASTDAPDDSDGRVGGGHGSDDPPGDDEGGDASRADDSEDSRDSDDDSGRGRGHGSDD